MSIINTTFTPAARLNSFTGIGDLPRQQRSAIPRGEVFFIINGGDVTKGEVGDTQRSRIDCTLPRNFAYALVGIHLNLYGVDITDWETIANSYISNDIADFDVNVPIVGVSPGPAVASGAGAMTYQFESFKAIIVPRGADATPNLHIDISNYVTDGTAMITSIYARFLQYDIEQANHWEVNLPQLTR